MTTVTAHQGERLDQLLGRAGLGPDDLGPALALNPGLAARGPVLTEGEQVSVPAAIAAAPRILDVVQLWD